MYSLSCGEEACSGISYQRGLCKYHYACVRKREAVARKAHFEQLWKENRTVRKGSRTVEAYLRCELFHRLKLLGIEMIPEYRDNGLNRYDGLVVHKELPLAVIEIKRDRARIYPQQMKKYEANSFKVPVIYCLGWGQLDSTITRVKALIPKT